MSRQGRNPGANPGSRAGRPDLVDGKDPDALRTIGEVAVALGIRPHVLRYWEQQFPALRPLKRSGGRRLYRPEDIALIRQIDQLLNRDGYKIKGARQALAEQQGKNPGATGTARLEISPEQTLKSLRAIRERLAGAMAVSGR